MTAKFFGSESEVTLQAFGGFASYNNFKTTAKQRLLITLNGPLLESMLIFIAFVLLKFGAFNGYLRYFLSATMWLNSIWCILNLLPLNPLDGGKIAQFFLTKWFGEKGVKLCVGLGIATVLIIVPILVKFGFYFFAIYLIICAFRNARDPQNLCVQSDISCLNEGLEALRDGRTNKAKALLTRLKRCSNTLTKNTATEALAEVYVKEEKKDKAYHLLSKMNSVELKNGIYLLCKLAYERGNYDIVTANSQKLYERKPTFETAILISKAFSHLHNAERANAWLKTASMFDGITESDIDRLLL